MIAGSFPFFNTKKKMRFIGGTFNMFTPFVQLRIYFKIWLLQRAVRALEVKAAKPAVAQNTTNLQR